MSKLHELAKVGQSIWFDFIRRDLLTRGQLCSLVESGVCGVTSNPAIFEKAILSSDSYDADILRLALSGRSVEEIYEALAVTDISAAADVLLPVYEKSGGEDGFVSLEVNPALANDATGTVAEAKRLFLAVNRPNLMIKVPATRAGLAAIRELIASGVNVNATLLFGLENYRETAQAYMEGLKRLVAQGPSVPGGHAANRVASVASLFVSRLDTALDGILIQKGAGELAGSMAVDNARAVYRAFGEIFKGPDWDGLKQAGARVQKLLWASTGVKNPNYPDTLYVDALIGPHTVNTLPPTTLEGFLDHGSVCESVTEGLDLALSRLSRLASLGIDLSEVTEKLQQDGLDQFMKAYESLLAGIGKKRDALAGNGEGVLFQLGRLKPAADAALGDLLIKDAVARIWAKDHTLWKDDPKEISNRLGWLFSPEKMKPALGEITAFVDEVKKAGYTRALLLGMGGSSMAPEVFRKVFGVREGFLDLDVLDSTDPAAVLAKAGWAEPKSTLFIVSTKSGGTVETLSFAKYFYNRALEALGPEEAGKRFAAITDPGSSLSEMAERLKFRKCFLNDPDIGGRYSGLSFFGLVPAALVGADVGRLLESGARAASEARKTGRENTALVLGAAMGGLALAGSDKLTLALSPRLSAFGAWAEQLVAESLGKEGRGVVPVDGEALGSPETYSSDRFFVSLGLAGEENCEKALDALSAAGFPVARIRLSEPEELAGEFFRWEMATAIAGAGLSVNPFDQPNVEAAKVQSREVMAAFAKDGVLPDEAPLFSQDGIGVVADFSAATLTHALSRFFSAAAPGEVSGKGRAYASIHAYVPPSAETDAAIASLQEAIRRRYGVAVTRGYGPRFLHSTGQLHKGDAGNGLFIQIVGSIDRDTPIPAEAGKPESVMSFGVLRAAQALGDAKALRANGRRVARFLVGTDAALATRLIAENLG